MEKLSKDFYKGNTIDIAKALLGKVLVHNVDNSIISGRIVEVEAYMGAVDKAAHSYNGRRTARNEVTYGEKGIAYVYFIYGMYYCFNVAIGEIDKPEVVLIRALEPLEGLEQMALNRYNESFEKLKKSNIIGLTNGPGKLCKALDINKSQNGEDLTKDKIYILEGNYKDFNVISSKRIGIDYAEEARDYPWRFYIENNQYVSKAGKAKL